MMRSHPRDDHIEKKQGMWGADHSGDILNVLWSLDAIWKKGLVKKEIVWYYIQALR